MNVIIKTEDALSEAVLCKIISETCRETVIYLANIEGGIGNIRNKMHQYCNASKAVPHLILIDQDNHECPPSVLRHLNFEAQHNKDLCIRVATRSVESWLLADKAGLANFLGVHTKHIPDNPESLQNPKQALINVARKVKRHRFKSELIPAKNSASQVGVLYNAHMSNFASNHWDISAAAKNSESLNRAISRIERFLRNETKPE